MLADSCNIFYNIYSAQDVAPYSALFPDGFQSVLETCLLGNGSMKEALGLGDMNISDVGTQFVEASLTMEDQSSVFSAYTA
jgi:hypothetical protein